MIAYLLHGKVCRWCREAILNSVPSQIIIISYATIKYVRKNDLWRGYFAHLLFSFSLSLPLCAPLSGVYIMSLSRGQECYSMNHNYCKLFILQNTILSSFYYISLFWTALVGRPNKVSVYSPFSSPPLSLRSSSRDDLSCINSHTFLLLVGLMSWNM